MLFVLCKSGTVGRKVPPPATEIQGCWGSPPPSLGAEHWGSPVVANWGLLIVDWLHQLPTMCESARTHTHTHTQPPLNPPAGLSLHPLTIP